VTTERARRIDGASGIDVGGLLLNRGLSRGVRGLGAGLEVARVFWLVLVVERGVCERGRPAAMDGRRNGHGWGRGREAAGVTRAAVLARQAAGCSKVKRLALQGERRCASTRDSRAGCAWRGSGCAGCSSTPTGWWCGWRSGAGGCGARCARIRRRTATTASRCSRPGAIWISGSGVWSSAPSSDVLIARSTGSGRGRAVRAARQRVHPRFRGAGRVAGDEGRQEHDPTAGLDRLGHRRADHRSCLRRRA